MSAASDDTILRLTAVEIAQKVKGKEISASEVVEAALRRMEILEPHIRAFSVPTPEVARAAAREVDRKVAAGEDPGPLAGVPIGIKDLVATKGIETAMGSNLFKGSIPDEDDIVVERLNAAGVVILGKTNVPELGYSGVGHNPLGITTRNPWNLALTPGGSSAGSGASVAAGVSPFAIGSDGGGSIRIPAAHSGLYGFKASMGRVPLYPGCRDERYPGVSSWESLEHIGPMSRTVANSALMLSVIAAGPDMRDRFSLPKPDFDWNEEAEPRSLKGLRVAYSPDWGYAPVDPEVRRLVGEAVKVFEQDLGCIVEEANPGLGGSGPTLLDAGRGRDRSYRYAQDDRGPRERGVAASGRARQEGVDGQRLHRCQDRPQDGRQQDVALHAALRPAAHADARRSAIPRARAGPGDHRRQDGR